MRSRLVPLLALAAAAAIRLLAQGGASAAEPSVAAHNSHVLVSTGDGAVLGWGSDLFGKLGTGRAIIRPAPGPIAGLPPIADIASYAYGYHFVARDTNGRVWTWGQNDFAQLGPRVQRNASLPGRVLGLSGVVQVAANEEASFALKSDGTVWAWGSGVFGTYVEPTRIVGLDNVQQISASFFHLFARRGDGTVWAVGWNAMNQLGVGAPNPVFHAYASPVQVPVPGVAIDIAATQLGGAARTNDGKVWSWGTTSFLALGDASPRQVTGFPATPARLSGGALHYHAVLPDNTIWRWGHATPPAQVPGFTNVRSLSADGGEDPTYLEYAVADNTGKLFIRSSNAYGQRGLGNTDVTDATVITQVPGSANFVDARWTNHCITALTATGELWVWGAEVTGSFGDGAVQSHAVPRAIAGVANARQVATGREFSAALDAAGNVWFWGENPGGVSGDDTYSPRSTAAQVPISGVKHIAAGWSHLLMVKNDGTLWITGYFQGISNGTPTQVAGLPAIKLAAAGHESSFAIAENGTLWAWGENAKGELGVGDTTPRAAPTQVALPGGASKVVVDYKHVLALNAAGNVYGWGDVDTRNTLGAPTNPGDIVTSPQPVAGIANVVDVGIGQFHYLARRADGTVLSWGPDWQTEVLGRDVNAATPSHVPSPVLELDSVVAIAGANSASFAIRSDGSVWGWGFNWASGAGPPVGDGTFVRRARPVVVIRENGAGNLDSNDWFLDAKPGTPKTIPAAKVPKVVSRATSLSSSGLLNVDGGVNVRVADQAKTLGLYVTGLVPVEFLAQQGAAPGAQAKVAHLKAGTLILVNLTPSGWTVVTGQLEAFASGVGNAFLGASGLLTNVNPAAIPGARFCIGYGESATDMLKTGTIRDFLSLQGASTEVLGQQCLLSGVYMDGPRTSPQGSAVPVRAVVVGQAPTGTVRFREGFTDIASNVAITPVNAAVADATFNYTPPAAGEYAFGAVYGGNGLNPSMSSEVPLRHTVQAVLANTTTRIEVPVTSEIGMEVPLVATVTGNRPGGTIQFKRGGVNEGAPVAVVNDQAVLTVVGLAIGTHSFTAHYSGDAGNQPSASAGFSHQVLNVATSRATLGSTANPAVLGDTVTLTATVTGTNPTGSVTLRERANVIQSKSLAGGSATFTLSGLTAGVHVYFVDYSGDGGNPATTSNAVFQQVTLNIPAGGDLDGDGVPNGVEFAEGTDPSKKDNDIFTSARLFAMQQYRDFLAREGDAGGIVAWSNNIQFGIQSRGQVIESFFGSQEFQGTIAPVARLYFAYFLRIPDYAGLNFWIGYYRAGNSLDSISNFFAGSAEFQNAYGALDNGQFVDLVYQNVLGRAPDAGGRAFWKNELDTGARSRGNVMLGFSESEEYRGFIANEVYVTMAYSGMLRRAPDAGGFSFWVQYMDSGNSGLALLDGFLASPEYRNRFLP